jgi:hypothetical protein
VLYNIEIMEKNKGFYVFRAKIDWQIKN